MMGSWIDLNTRKLTGLPDDLLSKFNTLEKSSDFFVLTKEHTRNFGARPQDLENGIEVK